MSNTVAILKVLRTFLTPYVGTDINGIPDPLHPCLQHDLVDLPLHGVDMSGDVLQSFDVVVVCCLDGCVLMCQNCCFRWRMCLKNAIETGQNVFSQSHLLYRFSKLVCCLLYAKELCHIPCMVVCYSALDRGAEYCDEHVCLSVCVCMYVCLSTIISSELQVPSSPNFLCMLPMAMVRFPLVA